MRQVAAIILLASSAAMANDIVPLRGANQVGTPEQAMAICEEQAEVAGASAANQVIANARAAVTPRSSSTNCTIIGNQMQCNTAPDGWSAPMVSGASIGLSASAARENARHYGLRSCLARMGYGIR